MTKKKTKTKTVRPSPISNVREWDADDMADWQDIRRLSLVALRAWAIDHCRDQRNMCRQLAEIRRLRKEEADGYQRDLAVAKRENLGKIQSNLLQTMQSMMMTLEGNSRSVHALAEPLGDLLMRLGKELDKAGSVFPAH